MSKERENALSLFALCDAITKKVIIQLGISKEYKDSKPSDMWTLDITPIDLVFNDNTAMTCDAIVLFGDGTLEFHDKETEDAFNFAEFDINSNKKVLNCLSLDIHQLK